MRLSDWNLEPGSASQFFVCVSAGGCLFVDICFDVLFTVAYHELNDVTAEVLCAGTKASWPVRAFASALTIVSLPLAGRSRAPFSVRADGSLHPGFVRHGSVMARRRFP